jgi:signal transduction histidine kinase
MGVFMDIQSSVISSLIGTILIILIYIYLYALYRERFMGIWAASWLILLSRFIIFDSGLLPWKESTFGLTVYQMLIIISVLMFVWGTHIFIEKPLNKWWLYGTASISILSVTLNVLYAPLLYKLLLPIFFGCFVCIWAGLTFIHHLKLQGIGRLITGYAYILWSLLSLTLPFLIDCSWFMPWGYSIGGILRMVIAVGTLMVYFEKARAELITKEEHFASLQQANQELNHFCHSVAHDFKGPLLSINQLAKQITLKYSEPLSSKGKEFLQYIQDKSAEVITMTDHLLELSRMSQKEIVMEIISLDLLFHQVYKELMELQPKRQVDFMLKPLPCIHGDPIMMKIMVRNILSNALKFTSIRQQASIEVSSVEEENNYIISVKDNGAGFNMQYSAKLFKIFERLHSADKFEGTGVGLVVCQKILLRHHGQAWLTGKLDEGAIFSFRFPKGMPKQSIGDAGTL